MDTELNLQDMEEADYLTALLLKQLRQEITAAELQYLENWKAGHPSFALVCEQVNDGEQLLAGLLAMKQVDKEVWWQKISEQIETVEKPVRLFRRWYTYAAAALVLLVAGAIIWQYNTPHKSPETVNEKNITTDVNVLPGGNKATLTLSNGAVINLGNATNGTVAEEGNVKVVKSKDGELKYELTTGAGHSKEMLNVGLNTLRTPRSGRYNLVLPDGSKVWLNAASSIQYPPFFTGNERRVTITGEAYFEVAPSNAPGKGAKKVPLIVTIQSAAGNSLAEVAVLGTQFNIMAYDDEAVINTTLVKGNVKVSVAGAVPGGSGHVKMLRPGQQAQIPQSGAATATRAPITVIEMEEVEEVMGWKDGYVRLTNADIKYIMRMISRWYNVEIDYQGKTPAYTYTGTLPFNQNLSAVIKVLEYGGLHFKQQGNKIIVMP
jgi:transmembrane sensor